MLKHILYTIILIPFFIKAQTNVYHPFPESNASWNFKVWTLPIGCSSYFIEYHYTIALSGDTLINNVNYQKLRIPRPKIIVDVDNCITHMDEGYMGAIRHDSLNRKVFFVEPSSNNEELLYDFNWEVGDTIRGRLEALGGPPLDTVESIDSVLVGSSYRKRWNLSNFYNVRIIEGIGSSYGLIYQSPGQLLDLSDVDLLCFQQDAITLYPNHATSCDIIVSSNSIEMLENQKIDIYPNPVKSEFTMNLNFNGTSRLIIYDISGRVIETLTPTSDKINIAHLARGTYNLKVVTEEDAYFGRFMKY